MNPRNSLLLAIVLCSESLSLAQDPSPLRSLTSVQRMEETHLRATMDDVHRLAASRQSIPPLPDLIDFRTVFHVHAEDSAHTGGTLPELIAAARSVGVHALFLSDHIRPPRDSFTDSAHGFRDGVLVIPGNEMRGLLVHPTRSLMSVRDNPLPDFLAFVRADDGLAFLSHVEERPDHPMDHLDGLEISNRHYDAKRVPIGLASLVLKMTDPRAIAALQRAASETPHALFGSQTEYPSVYIRKWDSELVSRRLTGVGAADCHHNNVMILKMIDADTVLVGTNVDADDQMRRITATLRPEIRSLTKGRNPGDILARVDLDPYPVGLLSVCTHILAPELSEAALRAAIRGGRAYVSHDWMADPTGTRFELCRSGRPDDPPLSLMGDERLFESGFSIRAVVPVPARLRLYRDGKLIAEQDGNSLARDVSEPGVYRLEAWLTLDSELRPWLYSNPIYLRPRTETKP
jgi:hypothetical protein